MAGFDLFSLAHQTEVEAWPDNHRAAALFARLGTQWRTSGMGMPTGLDYTSVLAVIGQLDLPRKDASDLFENIQVMEAAAIEAMSEKN